MAILGEANILIKAITTGVEKDIKNAMDKVGSGGNNPGKQAGERIGKSFKNSTHKEALAAAKLWTKLNRTTMTLQGAIGALVGSIASLGSGLFALAGALGQAGAAGIALVSTFAQVKVATLVAKSAMKGIGQAVNAASKSHGGLKKTLKEVREEMQQLAFDAEDAALSEQRAAMALEQAREELMRVQDLPPNSMARRQAELSYQEADLAYRRAKDRNADLQDQINNPPKKKKSGTDPFASLTKSQKDFAQYLISIKGKMSDLREAAASGFLPLLKTQIERVMKGGAFDKLVAGYNEVGVGLGKAAKSFVDALNSSGAIDNLSAFFSQTARTLPKLGTVLGNALGSFLGLMKAAEPLTKRFVDWLVKGSTRMSELVKLKSNDGTFMRFFKSAGDTAGQLGRILKNVFGGIGAMFKSATGPGSGGQLLLDWMERASQKFRETKQSFSGGLMDERNFKNSAENFKTIFQTLNSIIGAFKGAGGDPAVAGFWDAIKTAVPQIRTLVKNSVRTAASFGKLLAALIKIFSLFSDAGQANAFFDVLANSANGLYEIMKNLSWFFNVVGPILGAVSAFGLMAAVIGKLGLVMKGFGIRMAYFVTQLKFIPGATRLGVVSLKAMGTTAKAVGASMKAAFLSNPVFLAFMVAAEIAMWAFNAAAEAHQKEVDGITKSFENGVDAGTAWNTMVSKMSEGPEKAALSLDNMKESLEIVRRAGNLGDWWFVTKSETNIANEMIGKLNSFGEALGELANNDLEGAQKQFAGLVKAGKLNTAETKNALNNMPKYREALLAQADAMGINIRNADGTVNSTKQMEFALGEGEVKLRKAAAAAREFQQRIADAAAGMLNFNDAVKENTNKAGKVDVKGLIKSLAKQAQDAANYYSNLMRLKAKGVGQPVIDAIIGMGAKEGSAAAASLVNASGKELEALTQQYSKVGQLTSEEMSDKLAEAGPAIDEVMKKLGDSGVTAFVTALTSGNSIDQAMSSVLNKMNESAPKNMRYVYADGKIQLVSQVGKRYNDMATGGFVRPLKLARGGSILRAASGVLAGQGGPQADMIPAMLSAGEFVMNASSTARFLPMLNAMNQDSRSNNRLNSTVPSSQGGGGMSGSNISIVVQPAPGMSETELARQVSIEMARQMRRGA